MRRAKACCLFHNLEEELRPEPREKFESIPGGSVKTSFMKEFLQKLRPDLLPGALVFRITQRLLPCHLLVLEAEPFQEVDVIVRRVRRARQNSFRNRVRAGNAGGILEVG